MLSYDRALVIVWKNVPRCFIMAKNKCFHCPTLACTSAHMYDGTPLFLHGCSAHITVCHQSICTFATSLGYQESPIEEAIVYVTQIKLEVRLWRTKFGIQERQLFTCYSPQRHQSPLHQANKCSQSEPALLFVTIISRSTFNNRMRKKGGEGPDPLSLSLFLFGHNHF